MKPAAARGTCSLVAKSPRASRAPTGPDACLPVSPTGAIPLRDSAATSACDVALVADWQRHSPCGGSVTRPDESTLNATSG